MCQQKCCFWCRFQLRDASGGFRCSGFLAGVDGGDGGVVPDVAVPAAGDFLFNGAQVERMGDGVDDGQTDEDAEWQAMSAPAEAIDRGEVPFHEGDGFA